MKIAVFTEYFYPHLGGQEIKYYRIGNELLKRGHSIDIYTICRNNYKYCVLDGFKIYKIINIPGYGESGYRTIKDLMLYYVFTKFKLNDIRKKYDVLIVNQMPMIHLFIDYRRRFLSRVFVLDVVEYWKKPYFGLVYSNIIKLYDGFLALNSWVYKFLLSLIRENSTFRRVCMLPPGIEVNKYSVDSTKKNPYFLLYVGRLTKHKNLILIFRAMRYIKTIQPRYILHIVGTGPDLPYLKN